MDLNFLLMSKFKESFCVCLCVIRARKRKQAQMREQEISISPMRYGDDSM